MVMGILPFHPWRWIVTDITQNRSPAQTTPTTVRSWKQEVNRTGMISSRRGNFDGPTSLVICILAGVRMDDDID